MPGIPKSRHPRSFPKDLRAIEDVQAYIDSGDKIPVLVRGDYRGADFSDCDLIEAWFTESNLEGVSFRNADLHRAHLDDTNSRNADFSDAWLKRVEFSGSQASGASFENADLGSVEFFDVDARGANFRNSYLRGAGLSNSNLRGADLTNARLDDTVATETIIDDTTIFRGMSGSIYGPIWWVGINGEKITLDGMELEEWLTDRGASVQVLRPKG